MLNKKIKYESSGNTFTKAENPVYTTFPDPVVDNENESVITVTASAIKHF
ncbi:MAG: hypothetical protein PW786_12035 [Arachidicoccus sp.]|nr:hypothetical protein [Arachidicoccus sp.]